GYAAMWRRRAELGRRKTRLSTGAIEHLLERYGTLTLDVLHLIDSDDELARPLDGAPEYLAAEVAYAVDAEGARHLDDVLVRRTRLSFEPTHRGVATARHAASVMASRLGWDAAETQAEIAAYEQQVEAERLAQTLPDDAVRTSSRD